MNSIFTIYILHLILLFSNSKQNGTVSIEINGLKNENGKVNICLFRNQEGFPSDPNKAFKVAAASLKNGKAHYQFHDVPPGQYAVAVLHDENNNNKMDVTFYRKPKEGFGFSNNVKKMFSPPNWEEAKFDFSGDNILLKIDMRYL